jgi:hypothetical protein
MITPRSSASRASTRFLVLVPFWSLIGGRKRILGGRKALIWLVNLTLFGTVGY